MLEILLTLFLVGAVAGAFFSMPIAGPISILIVSRALAGKTRFCLMTAVGAALIETIIVFVAVFGISVFYEFYQPFLPYFLSVGAILVMIVGIRITRQKVDINAIESKTVITDKYENRGGLLTGVLINLTNLTLLINWSVASFITLTFVASIGLNIGGLDLVLNKNLDSISEITGSDLEKIKNNRAETETGTYQKTDTDISPLVMSLAFALGVGAGIYIWFYFLTKLIIKYRGIIKSSILENLIRSLGVILIFMGLYLGYRALSNFIS
jgi:threonine/homoserine/homoserine lactone efflux protein